MATRSETVDRLPGWPSRKHKHHMSWNGKFCQIRFHYGNTDEKQERKDKRENRNKTIPERDIKPKQAGLLGLERPKRFSQTWSKSSSKVHPWSNESRSCAISIVTLQSLGKECGVGRRCKLSPIPYGEPSRSSSCPKCHDLNESSVRMGKSLKLTVVIVFINLEVVEYLECK